MAHSPVAVQVPGMQVRKPRPAPLPTWLSRSPARSTVGIGVEGRPQGCPKGRAGRSGQVTWELGSKCFLDFRLGGALRGEGREGLGRETRWGMWGRGIKIGQSETPAPAERGTLNNWRQEDLWQMEMCMNLWSKTQVLLTATPHPDTHTHICWGGARQGAVVAAALNWALPVCVEQRARWLLFPFWCWFLRARLYLTPPPASAHSAAWEMQVPYQSPRRCLLTPLLLSHEMIVACG